MPGKTKIQSLKAVAEHLHMSVATVSWVLSGKGDEKKISLATQEKVLAYTREIGYHPNLLARALNVGRTNTVGLIIPSISDTFYSGIAKAVESCLDKLNYSLMICSSDSDGEREGRMVRIMKSHQVDGIIIAPTKQNLDVVQGLIDEHYPLVLFDRFFSDLSTNYILINNRESSCKLVDNMIRKGARKIAIVTTNPYLTTLSFRLEGYLDALKKNGLSIDPNLIRVIDIHGYEENVPLALGELFCQVPDVDGFFFTTHILAIEAFNYFINNGIDYNSRFKLASIHEESLFKIIAPKMDIALMPIQEIGRKAVDILLKEVERKFSKEELADDVGMEHLILPCKMLYRE